jgi:hypothetical protein
VASHGYLAEARRQSHRALCPAHNLENIAASHLLLRRLGIPEYTRSPAG